MKNICLIALFCLISFTCVNSVLGDRLILVADNWCPYNCDPDSGQKGYMIDLAEAILAEAGHSIEYKAINWSRSIIKSREGKYHGIIGAVKAEAPDFIFPEKPLGLAKNKFWVKKGDPWRYSGVDSLKNRWLGIIKDYDYGKKINKYIEEKKGSLAVQIRSGDDALDVLIKKLENGRINVLNEDRNVFMHKINELKKNDLFDDAGDDLTSVETSYVYIAFSPFFKQSKTYAKILSDGIIKYRKNGKLQKILNKYGLKDWK
ncbi:ABC transporter periplasmic substrate binding protein [Candidatus Magnetomorum sp. HK-1]|nr:ABC transporter periplasmic substrate binding protein [Candidatus Magnetomorum sp. HK-1]